MTQFQPLRVLFILTLACLGLAACGDKDDDAPQTNLASFDRADDILAFVPADTPYVFASLEAMPDAVLDKLEANSDSMMSAYEVVMTETIESMQAAGEMDDEEESEKVIEFLSELFGMLQSDQLRAAGIPRSPRAAFYGVGLLPVARLNLADTDAFRAKIAELAEKAEADLEVGEVDGQAYQFVGDEELRLVVAVIDEQAVATFVPSDLTDDLLKAVLGLTKPDRSIADAGTLQAVAEKYELASYTLGFVDFVQMAATFVDAPTGVNAALLDMMDYDAQDMSAACRDEIRQVAGIAPRLVAGYNSVSTTRITSSGVLELRDDIARGLQALAVPVAGMGVDHGGFMSFGMSLDLMAARDFYESRLDALEADPYECEFFAGMQAGLAAGRQSLNQPVPPVFYGFKGFLAVIDDIGDIDFASQQPPTDVDARFLVANNNVEGLLAMGSMFSPELASLDIQPDGKPVALNLPPFTSQFDEAFVAMTGETLGVSIGEGSGSALASLVNSDAANPPPFMSVNLDGARYYDFMSEVIAAGAAEDDPNMSAEAQAAMSQVMTGIGDLIERISLDVTFTDNGIEMPSTVTLAD